MTEKNHNTLPVIPSTERETLQTRSEITTIFTGEEHPTPVAIGAEAPPSSVSLDLSGSGPFGAY